MPTRKIQPTAVQELQARVHQLEQQVSMLLKMAQPAKIRRGVIEWLNEQHHNLPHSYTDLIRAKPVCHGLLQTLQKQGIQAATMALWSGLFDASNEMCPLRCYDLAPSVLYGFDGKEWIRVTPVDFKRLVQVSEQWFLRAIKAEYPHGGDTAHNLSKKIFDSSPDNSKLRTRIANFVKRSLKSIKIYEFEP
jgi:hypothetical protein